MSAADIIEKRDYIISTIDPNFLREFLLEFIRYDRIYKWSDEKKQWEPFNGYYLYVIKFLHAKIKELYPDIDEEMFIHRIVGKTKISSIGHAWFCKGSVRRYCMYESYIKNTYGVAFKNCIYKDNELIPRTNKNAQLNSIQFDWCESDFKYGTDAKLFFNDITNGKFNILASQLAPLVRTKRSTQKVLFLIDAPPVVQKILEVILGPHLFIQKFNEKYLVSKEYTNFTTCAIFGNPDMVLFTSPYISGYPIGYRFKAAGVNRFVYSSQATKYHGKTTLAIVTAGEYKKMFQDKGNIQNERLLDQSTHFIQCKKADYALDKETTLIMAKGLVAYLLRCESFV
jgi:hypothetical protein